MSIPIGRGAAIAGAGSRFRSRSSCLLLELNLHRSNFVLERSDGLPQLGFAVLQIQ